jgi:hypothetical protein
LTFSWNAVCLWCKRPKKYSAFLIMIEACFFIDPIYSPDSFVGKVTRLRLGSRGNTVRFAAGTRDLFLKAFASDVGSTQPPSSGCQGCFPGGKVTGTWSCPFTHLVQRLRVRVSLSQLPYLPSCHGYGQLYFAAWVVPWLRGLIAGLSPHIPGFDPSPIHVGFMVNKVTLLQVFLRILRFLLSTSFHHQRSIFLHLALTLYNNISNW